MDNIKEVGDLRQMAKGRKQFKYKDQVVYEWEQALDEIIIYIKTPDCLKKKNLPEIKKNLKEGMALPKLEVIFQPGHLKLGIRGTNPYLDEDLAQKIKPSDSLWELEEDEITITLTKALKGETWLSVFKNHDQLNFMEKEEVQKKLLLERFQEEHGGFDFSDAEVNGNVPDPRQFLGGMNTTK